MPNFASEGAHIPLAPVVTQYLKLPSLLLFSMIETYQCISNSCWNAEIIDIYLFWPAGLEESRSSHLFTLRFPF